jgi:hypothetical protein
MDHITLTIATATPDQLARAFALAETFAQHSGIQAHSGAKDHILSLYNIIQTDSAPPVPPAAKKPASAAGTVPTYSVPLDAEGNIHEADREILLSWLFRWPSDVALVSLHLPRHGETITLTRSGLINALKGV